MKDPRLAAALSAVFTGLGQIYNGQLVKGMLFAVVQLVNVSVIPLGVGLVTAPLFWGYAVYDAYRVAAIMSSASTPRTTSPPDRGTGGE